MPKPELPKLPPTPGQKEVREISDRIDNPAAAVWAKKHLPRTNKG